jgi:hypothetical protein
VRERPFASFDLGLALFHLGERYGRRFGEEDTSLDGGPSPAEQQLAELRQIEVECALRAVLAVANERDVPIELRARTHYLAGNLEFLRRGYAEAVRHYDETLKLIPGMPDGGDAVGRDAAWNRAIALARIEEEKKRDAGQDAPPNDASGDAGKQHGDSGKREPQPDGGGRGQPEAAPPEPEDAGSSHPPPPSEAGAPPEPPPQQPPPTVNQDERMLDMLESAPTFQEQDAKNRGAARKHRGKVDK